MPLQYSRGCPYNCEFCDIIEMFGRVPRTKTAEQFLREHNAMKVSGFRGSPIDPDCAIAKEMCSDTSTMLSGPAGQKR